LIRPFFFPPPADSPPSSARLPPRPPPTPSHLQVNATLAADRSIKLVFLCSPGNPTGTLIPLATVRAVLDNAAFGGLVVVDEAYIDFAGEDQNATSAVSLVERYDNVCVSQTLSKGHGLAAIRCVSPPPPPPPRAGKHASLTRKRGPETDLRRSLGLPSASVPPPRGRLGVAYAAPPLIQILSNTKAPYNISTPTAALAQAALAPSALTTFHANVQTLLANRSWLREALGHVEGTGRILGRPHANFVLVQILDRASGRPSNDRAKRAYLRMAEREGVVVRFRGNERGCEGCLRITVGTRQECERAIDRLRTVLAEDGGEA